MRSRHHEIADDLRHQITGGRILPSERLPSEAALADRYRVSTVTLRRALAVLQTEGLVEKIQGKGNFVRRPHRKIMYIGGWGTLDPWTAAEPDLRVTIRSTAVQAQAHLATLLEVPTGTSIVEFTCLSHEGESPHSLARVYMPHDLVPPEALDDASTSREAATRFAFLGPPPTAARETVSARLPAPDEASALRIGIASIVLSITRIATNSAGRVVEAALLAFPGDRVDAVFTTHHVIDERQSKG
ncbi:MULTISPECIES: GntR family transcriptional regulator [Streptomyces]|uniref:GntR-family regulator n=1 Tax=Streptomyces coelicolor (strain ATCC BAA-471 / A3(2) / M145) TaxID=100226 RepID=Q9X8D7_STRCO|nr:MULTISPECIES: GntR family transcriptional regulator [Streptomyces]MDX2929946.1 GntR family transcriptional regulator [Streptomyces sp. NRRL_B-16638]MDX3408168.1 GntR family transcriptional regulator [Streptomyces sp. ME02-6977A]MYU42787.1 UTRA domain-containing protein [Streptomyces sp. SID7813]QFI43328.1 GntR family transcriptional regulator [Streptomyces coelicolor A3(2)]TYP01702.1 GntR family transcriptional regulator [Streptomyces coelicolor]